MSTVIKKFETHDRLIHLQKTHSEELSACCEDLIKKTEAVTKKAFYIFVHARTSDDGRAKKIAWQARFTKPTAETNSTLFLKKPGRKGVSVIWNLPDERMWDAYESGMLKSETIIKSIDLFKKGEL